MHYMLVQMKLTQVPGVVITCEGTCQTFPQYPCKIRQWELPLAGLAHYLPQSNNFVVFTAYFQSARQQSPAGATWVSLCTGKL